MIYLIPLLLVTLSLFFHNSKALFSLWGLYFFILFGFNTYNPDYLAYANIYRLFNLRLYDGTLSDSGFIFLLQRAIALNLRYDQFLIYFALLCTVLLFYFIAKKSQYKNLVCSLLLFYPMTIGIVQIRFFLASIIVMMGLLFLEKESKKSVPLFLLCLLIASTIHFSSIIYGILLLAKSNSFKKLYLYVFLFLFGSVVLYQIAKLLNISIFLVAINNYLVSSTDFKGIVFLTRVLFFRLIPVFFIYYLYKYFKQYFQSSDVFMMKSITIIMLLTMFFEIFETEFERFSRIGYILMYILLFNVSMRFKIASNKLLVPVIFLLYFVFYMVYQYFYRVSGDLVFFESVFLDIFENNQLIK